MTEREILIGAVSFAVGLCSAWLIRRAAIRNAATAAAASVGEAKKNDDAG
jgi:hypothetical protein